MPPKDDVLLLLCELQHACGAMNTGDVSDDGLDRVHRSETVAMAAAEAAAELHEKIDGKHHLNTPLRRVSGGEEDSLLVNVEPDGGEKPQEQQERRDGKEGAGEGEAAAGARGETASDGVTACYLATALWAVLRDVEARS